MYSFLRLGRLHKIGEKVRQIRPLPFNGKLDTLKFYSSEYVEMSEDEVKLIKDTWVTAQQNCYKLGKSIFKHLFEAHPHYLDFFSRFGSTPEELLENHEFVDDHAITNVCKMFGKSVKDIHEPAEADSFARVIGKAHRKFCIEPIHFKNFQTAMLAAIAEVVGDEMTPEAKKAWKKGSDVIFNGYITGLTKW